VQQHFFKYYTSQVDATEKNGLSDGCYIVLLENHLEIF